MPTEKSPSEAELAELSESLAAGIETCQSVVANYKSLLTSNDGFEANREGESEPTDAPELIIPPARNAE